MNGQGSRGAAARDCRPSCGIPDIRRWGAHQATDRQIEAGRAVLPFVIPVRDEWRDAVGDLIVTENMGDDAVEIAGDFSARQGCRVVGGRIRLELIEKPEHALCKREGDPPFLHFSLVLPRVKPRARPDINYIFYSGRW